MTEEEATYIATKVADELVDRKRARWIEPEIHAQHHGHVSTWIQRESDLTELKKKIIYSACMWAVPLIIAFVLSSFWQSIVRVLKGALR